METRVRTALKAFLGALLGCALAGTCVVNAQQVATPAPLGAPAAPSSLPAGTKPAMAAKPAVKPAPKPPAPKTLDKPLWSELTKPQQLALEPLAADWDKMEGQRKAKYLAIAKRYATMKPDEQQRVHDRMRDWVKLTPEQRVVARENYARVKKIDPTQKSAQWEQYQQLPEEQKKKLAADAAVKKQVANLPSTSQSKVKTVAPIKGGVAKGSASAHAFAPAVPATAVPATKPASATVPTAVSGPIVPPSNAK